MADLRRYLQNLLGITDIRRELHQIHNHLHEQEHTMSALSDQLGAAYESLSGLQADVQVLLDRANVPADDPEAQAAADRLTQFVDTWRSTTPDADGSDTPADPGTSDTGDGDPTGF